MRTRRVYFDYAASTPVNPRVVRAMRPYFAERYGNPGSLHSFGQEAIAAIDRSRETIGKMIGAEFREIIFTASATEANNLALRGVVPGFGGKARPKVIVSALEHESVLETAREMEQNGVEVVYLPVGRSGFVDVKRFASVLDDRTVLVSVMYAQNEVGTIQPIAEMGRTIAKFRKRALRPHYPLFHTDAAQAFQFLNCNVNDLGVDLMTLSAHKIYGPKGIGALYVRSLGAHTNFLNPIVTGGGQEFGLRPGTENVPLIVGFAEAAELVHEKKALHAKRVKLLRDSFWRALKRICPAAEVNGALKDSVPSILNVYLPGSEAQDILTALDLQGVALSSGSACRSRSLEPSYVIRALGYDHRRARQSIRVSFGRPTRKAEVDRAVAVLRKSLSS